MEGHSFPKAFERREKNFFIQGNFYEELKRYAKKGPVNGPCWGTWRGFIFWDWGPSGTLARNRAPLS